MAAKDPHVRHLAASVAANARHSQVPYPHRPVVPPDSRSRYEREVDPLCQLDEDTRRKRALSAWRRDVALAALREAQSRRGHPA
jgi:hypothetical protein